MRLSRLLLLNLLFAMLFTTSAVPAQQKSTLRGLFVSALVISAVGTAATTVAYIKGDEARRGKIKAGLRSAGGKIARLTDLTLYGIGKGTHKLRIALGFVPEGVEELHEAATVACDHAEQLEELRALKAADTKQKELIGQLQEAISSLRAQATKHTATAGLAGDTSALLQSQEETRRANEQLDVLSERLRVATRANETLEQQIAKKNAAITRLGAQIRELKIAPKTRLAETMPAPPPVATGTPPVVTPAKPTPQPRARQRRATVATVAPSSTLGSLIASEARKLIAIVETAKENNKTDLTPLEKFETENIGYQGALKSLVEAMSAWNSAEGMVTKMQKKSAVQRTASSVITELDRIALRASR
ncbi:hypothetical protein HN446_00920 [bacterium]|jgi:hypothetical protein|nr:hypothetical protein [bacterium]